MNKSAQTTAADASFYIFVGIRKNEKYIPPWGGVVGRPGDRTTTGFCQQIRVSLYVVVPEKFLKISPSPGWCRKAARGPPYDGLLSTGSPFKPLRVKIILPQPFRVDVFNRIYP